jgi:kynurenine formamidase
LTADEFEELFREVSTWGRWDEGQERGALNYLTNDRVAAASGLVRSGVCVTLSLPVATHRAPDDPVPADHHMTMLADADMGARSLQFTKDYIGADYHNEGHTHVDAFCHVVYGGKLYGGVDAGAVTARGAEANAIDLLERGLVGRGVLLDIPRVRDVPWLDPGEDVLPQDLAAAEQEQGVAVGAGDILLVRTGLVRRLAELGPWDTREAKAGLHPTVARFLSERRVAALGSDGNNDTAPSTTDGVGFPIHVLALNAMGVHLFDYLQLEDLVAACEAEGRWEFLFVASPLRIVGGTGSPLNPIAIF